MVSGNLSATKCFRRDLPNKEIVIVFDVKGSRAIVSKVNNLSKYSPCKLCILVGGAGACGDAGG